MQYTIRNIPAAVDRALRRRAAEQGASLNDVVVDVLRTALGLEPSAPRRRDLSDVVGCWQEDDELDAALASQRVVDDDAWR